jgi:hypothetical protein
MSKKISKSVPCKYYIKEEEELGTTLTTPTVYEAHNRHKTPPAYYDLTTRAQHLTLRPRAPPNGPATNDVMDASKPILRMTSIGNSKSP